MPREKTKGWGLVLRPGYTDALSRLSSKNRGMVARKSIALTENPAPGGSRTTLKGYDGLCRVRAGDYRIIYAYNESTVELLTLRRRDEKTYDSLDELEIGELKGFKGVSQNGAGKAEVADWMELARGWGVPPERQLELLPVPITEQMLLDLRVEKRHWEPLKTAKTCNDLLDCEAVPDEIREQVLEAIYPRPQVPFAGPAVPVLSASDLVDKDAAVATGPIHASPESESVPGAPEVSRGGGSPPVPPVLFSSMTLDPMKPYSGNTAKGIGKDARYKARLDGTIALEFNIDDREHVLLTTDEHPQLLKLVNEAKRHGGGQSDGGGFIINEYRHVLVPTMAGQVLFAGTYTPDLEFSFEGVRISPVAPRGISPGDIWPGPHVGVRYTLAAGASDVRYEQETPRGTQRKVLLTDFHTKDALAGLLSSFKAVKPNGGAIYINEARELFAPVDDGQGYKRRYIGHLGKRPWFPEPK